MKMTELLIFGIMFVLLALTCLYRLKKGPSAGDRMISADTADMTLCCAMAMFSLYSGRGIYLDIAVITAVMGIIDTMLVGRHLEGRQ